MVSLPHWRDSQRSLADGNAAGCHVIMHHSSEQRRNGKLKTGEYFCALGSNSVTDVDHRCDMGITCKSKLLLLLGSFNFNGSRNLLI